MAIGAFRDALRKQPIAYPATDDERPAAGVAHGARKFADHLGSCSTVHASIINQPRHASDLGWCPNRLARFARRGPLCEAQRRSTVTDGAA
jgi:hypothetical protein